MIKFVAAGMVSDALGKKGGKRICVRLVIEAGLG